TGQLQITVRDSGPGIPANNVWQLFHHGFSTKGVGRGLGLHLVREAVKRLGGDITYRSRKGTIFNATIPITLDTHEQMATTVFTSVPPSGSVSIVSGQDVKAREASMANRNAMRILFLAANPRQTTSLDLEEEIRSLEVELR